MTLDHYHVQHMVWIGLCLLSVAEVAWYGVPAILAAPALLINTLWVWE